MSFICLNISSHSTKPEREVYNQVTDTWYPTGGVCKAA